MNVVHGWRYGISRLRRVRRWDLLLVDTSLRTSVGDGTLDSRQLRWAFCGLDLSSFYLRRCIFAILDIISTNNLMKIYPADLRRMQRGMQFKLKLTISRITRKSRTGNNFVLGQGKLTIIPVTPHLNER